MVISSGGEISVQRHDLGELYQQLSELDRSDTYLNRQLGHLYRERRLFGTGDAVHDIVSLESLDAQCETLFNSRELNRSYRETLRKDINVCSRPHLRPLTILDMPDEILVKVCEYLDVEGSIDILRYGSAFICSPSDIKNLRLTCRRFCNTNSHLLLPFVRVELNKTSVEHLVTVSQHPTISKGVRAVKVVLDYYDYELANDFALFAEYFAAKLAEHAGFLEYMDREKFKDQEIFKDQEGNRKETIQKAWQLENFCLSFASGAVDEADFGANPSHRNLLQRAHEEYRSSVTDQKQVCENGTFCRTVAAAIDRMPRARRLELREHDGESPRRKGWAPFRAGDDLYFLYLVLRPMTWGEGRLWALGAPHIDLLVLPSAFHEAATILKSLNINITSPPEAQDALTAEAMRSLSLSVQQLK